MMKKEFSDEQIREMRDILTGHEEAYVEGAWENFSAMRRRKRLIYRLSASGIAAALVVVFLGITFLSQPDVSDVPEKLVADATPADATPIKVIEKQEVQQVAHQVAHQVAQPAAKPAGETPKVAGETPKVAGETSAEVVSLKEVIEESINKKELVAQNVEETKDTIAVKEPARIISAQGYDFDEGRKLSERRSSEKRVRFGVNLSPGVNTTASSSTFNYSGGVNVEIKLAKNLQLSTGVQIEHQDIDNRSTVRMMSQPAMEAGAVATYLPPSHITASITNLDIPLNIKWNFINSRNTGYYVAAGISSLAYLRESYQTTTYRQELREKTLTEGSEKITTFGLENVPTITTNTISQSRTPDIAGRFNLIFGIEQRISSTLKLHVEPFMKVPLTGLATENLMFTTGGITFKVSF